MKIGDKVRFLSDTGGGIIAGFKGRLVLVEDEDGFQIPPTVPSCASTSNRSGWRKEKITAASDSG